MVNYRRARLPGATYFFTVTLRDRRSRMLTDHVYALREAVKCVKRRWPFRIDAVVVLPDHLHTIWTLPEGEIHRYVRLGLLPPDWAAVPEEGGFGE